MELKGDNDNDAESNVIKDIIFNQNVLYESDDSACRILWLNVILQTRDAMDRRNGIRSKMLPPLARSQNEFDRISGRGSSLH